MRKNIKHRILAFVAGTLAVTGCAVYNNTQPALPVSDIVQMSQDGIPSKNIIKEIRKTHSVYMLKADKLAELSREGVPDSVLNYMDRTRINAVRQDERSYGYYGPYDYWYGPGFWPYGYAWPGYWGYGMGSVVIVPNHSGHYHGHIRR
jgi:hypothetical protein